MTDEKEKKEPFDEYADQFTVTFNPYGVILSFATGGSLPPEKGQKPPSHPIGTIRMSMENLKIMLAVAWRQILHVEQKTGVREQISPEVLEQFQVSTQEWEAFWKKPR